MADRFYELTVAGCTRSLPILNVTDKLAIAGFIMLGDTELVEECAKVLVTKLPADIDYLICPEAKAIPLAHAMARMMGINYIVIRKSVKVYMENPLIVDVQALGKSAALAKNKSASEATLTIESRECEESVVWLVQQTGGRE